MARISLLVGDGNKWQGEADVVFTQPYWEIPECLRSKPQILNSSGKVRGTQIGKWGVSNTVHILNLPWRSVELSDLKEDGEDRGCGFMPLELPLRLFDLYADIIKPGMTVWDGFCGRATIGKAAQMRGLNYIGIDIDPRRIAAAKAFIA